MRNWRSEKGNVLVLTALLLPVLLGMGALAVDAGYLFDYQQQLSGIADAAAVAAAGDMGWYAAASPGTVTAQASAAALAAAQLNDPTLTASNVVANCPPITGPLANGTCATNPYVQVTITKSVPTFLMRVLGTNAITVSETAMAGSIESDVCVMALSTGTKVFYTSELAVGSGATINLPNCRIVSNDDLTINGSGHITAQEVDTTGTCNNCGASRVSGSVKQNAPKSTDPMLSLDEASLFPSFTYALSNSCQAWSTAYNQPSMPKSGGGWGGGTITGNMDVYPGIYCGDATHPALSMTDDTSTSSYQYILHPGVYTIVGGSGSRSGLEIGKSTSVTGSDVTFYFTGNDFGHPYQSCGSVSVNLNANTGGGWSGWTSGSIGGAGYSGSETLRLEAPTTGARASLLFVQDRSQGICSESGYGTGWSGWNFFSGAEIDANLQHAGLYLNGLIYFPAQHVDMGGQSATPPYWGVIAGTVTFTGPVGNSHNHNYFSWNFFRHSRLGW